MRGLFLSNGRVAWKMDDTIGERFLNNTYALLPEGWRIVEGHTLTKRVWYAVSHGLAVRRVKELRYLWGKT